MRVGVLASGSGTNLQALNDACSSGYAPAEIAVVLSNKADAYALVRADRAGVRSVFVDPGGGCSREEYDRMLAHHLDEAGVDLVCGAGYMRILTPDFVRHFENRILNVHPSLLPAFTGLHAIEQAHTWGVKVTGATVHLIDRELDHGPIVCQRAIDVVPGESLDSLEERIHLVEYALYPKALKLFAEGRVTIDDRHVLVDGPVDDPPWVGRMPPGLAA